jgi:hypothetical protein
MTQLDNLYTAIIKDGEIITRLDANTRYGIKNLRARINELRQMGFRGIRTGKFNFNNTKKETGYYSA